MTCPRSIKALQLSTRAAIAAGAAVAIAHAMQLEFPLYAMISAVIVTDLSPTRTRELALPRLAGTVLGAIFGACLSAAMAPTAWIIGAGIFAATIVTLLLRLPDAAKLAGYVCGIVLLDHPGHAWSYALDRFVETVLGIAIAVVVSFVPKLIRVEEPHGRDA